MNKPLWGTIALLVLALAAGGGYWIGQQRSPSAAGGTPGAQGGAAKGGPPAGGIQSVTVSAVKVTTSKLPQTITAVGSLRSDESITVRPEVAGRISAILFQEGQRVPKGAMLVKLEPSINEADVQQARANLKLAQSKFDRAIDLAKSNFISGQARDEAENNLRVAEASVQLAEAKLAKTKIVAPFSGIIGLRSVSVGDYVKEGQDIVNLESIDPLKVDFRVPEIYLRQVQVGQSLQVGLDALRNKFYEGRVFAINPLVDAAGRAIVIRAQVKNQDAALRPGMFARVRLITSEQQDANVVPEQVIVPQGDEQYVFKIVDGKAVRVKVTVGQRREGVVEIVSGLNPGDVVVSAGQLKLRDGASVTIAEPAGAASAAASADARPAPAATAGAPDPPKAEPTPPAPAPRS